MNEKVDEYFKLLHPEFDTASEEEQAKLMKDREFIEKHLEEIDKEYPKLMAYYGAKEGDPQVIQDTIKNIKVQTYWRMLYPNLEGLNAQDNPEVARDRGFIAKHLAEIDKEYPELMAYYGAKAGDQQVIQDTIKNIKVQTYWRMLYPNLEGLNVQDNPEVVRDREFIEKHLAEIDKEYPELMAYYGAKEGDPQVIQGVINNLKTLEAKRQEISTQKIGKATVNAPTELKEAARQVEIDENTKDNIKEGEEVGDDN